ncbi:hypothetical protein VP01_1041g7 [Puccinia sorghi]|uniref:Uncharacterized protein n=1 Tax=Puccinia sorghi TaxID=27349 RepID=A0A0L6VUL6_9BASI|nr:hypothetical protein VP01_1041g7 [Puccinia sorghi]
MSSCMLSSGLTSSNSRNHAGDCFQQSTRAQAGGILEDYGNLGEKTRLEQGERNLYRSNPASGSTPGGSSRPPAPSHSIQLKFSSCSGIAIEKLEEAVGLKIHNLGPFKVFDLYPMTYQTCAALGSITNPNSLSWSTGLVNRN